MNGYKDDMVYYYNILLSPKATAYFGTHATLMDIMEKQGGMMQCMLVLAMILASPFSYKRHELQIFCDYEEKFVSHSCKKHHQKNTYVEKIQSSWIPIELRLYAYEIKKYIEGLLCCCKKKTCSHGHKKCMHDTRKVHVENMDDVIAKMDHLTCEIYDKQSFILLHEIQDTKDQIKQLDNKQVKKDKLV